LKFRLTEFNSVTCGGKAGVSNTFATALWAPDALFTAMRAGVDGANLHVRNDTVNTPFTIDRSGLHPRPLLYGLEMFTRTLGPQAQLVRLHLAAARSLNLSAWAVQVRGRILHLLLVDKGSRTVRVDLRLPTRAPGTVQRLLAASPYSRSGETLNGQRLNYAGDWTGTPRTETIVPGPRGGYELTVPRRSAALMSVPLATAPPRRSVSEHHRRVAVTKHAVLAVGLHRSRKH
jgi:glycosyl hydrolase family 79